MSDLPKTKIVRLPPHHYVHVQDRNTNLTRLEVGPLSLVTKEHERVILGPEKMIVVLPRNYVTIENPVAREMLNQNQSQKAELDAKEREPQSIVSVLSRRKQGKVLFDENGQAKLRQGESEIRFEQTEPFPLYPGEKIRGGLTPLTVVEANKALRLKALRDFVDILAGPEPGIPINRVAGSEWLFEGPKTYYPQVEIRVVETITARIVRPNEALKLQARRDFTDRSGKKRIAGEKWLWRQEGAYLPDLNENVLELTKAVVLTEKKALHLKATQTFVDVFGKQRKAGDEWLVTLKDKETHLPDVYEQVISEDVPLITLNARQFCFKSNHVGRLERIVGETHFFLQPGESLEKIAPTNQTVMNNFVLGEDEALIVDCKQEYQDDSVRPAVKRRPGETFYVYGPTEYIPPLQANVVRKVKAALQLDFLKFYALYSNPVVLH